MDNFLFSFFTLGGIAAHLFSFLLLGRFLSHNDLTQIKGGLCAFRPSNIIQEKQIRRLWLVIYSTLVSVGSLWLSLKMLLIPKFYIQIMGSEEILIKSFILMCIGICFSLWHWNELIDSKLEGKT